MPRSSRGRSAVARRVIMSGSTNGMMPQGPITTNPFSTDGVQTLGPKRYFGGDKKGGSAPSATGFMIPSGRRARMASSASRPNLLFRFKTGPGPAPFGFGPHA